MNKDLTGQVKRLLYGLYNFNPQLKLWANAIIRIELTHNCLLRLRRISCGLQNSSKQKKISTISMVSEIFLDFAELIHKSYSTDIHHTTVSVCRNAFPNLPVEHDNLYKVQYHELYYP